jgi:hypothetical protein
MLISQVKLINKRRLASYSNTCKGIQTILINISHDYNVVINPYSSHHSIMKLIIIRNDCNRQVLPISEGIAETQANLTLERVIT